MTTTTLQPQRSNGLGLLTGLVLVIAIAIVGLMMLDRLDPQPMARVVKLPEIVVLPENHAEINHAAEAPAIRKCLQDKGGADMIFRNKAERGKFHALCQLADGKWGMRSFLFSTTLKVWVEVNAFIPKDGTWANVQPYILRQATKFKGPFPWE